MEVLTLAENQRWQEAVTAIEGWDVYWLPGYARFWEANGDGEAALALLEEGGERVAMAFLRRPVPGTDWWDLTTPYGYGGPLASPGAARCGLLRRFHEAFAGWAAEGGAVSAFVRFHPLLDNHTGAVGEVIPKSQTVYLDLAAAPPETGFKTEVRNRIRKAERAGLTTRLTRAPADIRAFVDLYGRTMTRREATGYYHFREEAFAGLLQDLPEQLLLGEVLSADGEVAAAALFLYNDRYLHYHLGGSDPAWLHLAPNNKLFADAARWGREQGLRQMHLGGGMRPGDSLFRFKTGFSPLRAEYHVGQVILNETAYRELTGARQAGAGGRPLQPGWFPAYRAPLAAAAEGESATAVAEEGGADA